MTASFKEWYDRNAPVLNARRKDRYRNDPDYRDKVRKWNDESRQKKKDEERQGLPPDVRCVKDVHGNAYWVTDTLIDETKGIYYSGKALAKLLACTMTTLARWERSGVIAEPNCQTVRGDRMYTLAEMTAAKEAASKVRQPARRTVGSDAATPSYWWVRFGAKDPELVPLYTVIVLAQALGRNPMTIQQLEVKGYFPRTPLRASVRGRRYYTAEMIEVAANLFGQQKQRIRGEDNWERLFSRIEEGWTKVGAYEIKLIRKTEANVEFKTSKTDNDSGSSGAGCASHPSSAPGQ